MPYNYPAFVRVICNIATFCDVGVEAKCRNFAANLPKARKYADDRAPTLEEVQTIMEYPGRRIKSKVATMVS